MTRRAVLIFARSPEAEAAAKHLPIEKAARLFRSLLDSWLDAARACGATPIIRAVLSEVFLACIRNIDTKCRWSRKASIARESS